MERNKTLSVRGKKKNATAGGTNFAQENPMHHKARKKKTQKSGTKVDAFVRTESITSAAEVLAETFISQHGLSKHMAADSTPQKKALPVIQLFETQPQKTLKKTAANNILVVAHPSAQAQQVFELLKASGVQEALPSRREQLSPQALTATLLKAHGLQWQDGQSPAQIEFLQVSSMWQSLVLDLALGNMEQPLWAWMEPQAIHLLDFWAQQNEQTVFMLVYDDIQNIYQQCLQEGEDASPEAINAKVQTWVAYNEALLQFHLRNPERSFLVHAKQVVQSAQSYLQLLNQHIASPLQLQQLPVARTDFADVRGIQGSAPAFVNALCSEIKEVVASPSSVDALTAWIMDQFVHTHTEALVLYEQLQAVANLPLTNSSDISSLKISPMSHDLNKIWERFVDLKFKEQENYHLLKLKENNEIKIKKNESEFNFLLMQLSFAQEKLEDLNLKNKKIQQDFDRVKKYENIAIEHSKQLEEMKKLNIGLEATIEKNKLQIDFLRKEIKKLNVKKSSEVDVYKENEFLLKQLSSVQEKLQKCNFELKKYKSKKSDLGREKIYYGSAERVKQQLSYRLGNVLVKKTRTFNGVISSPFLLIAEIVKFKKYKSLNKDVKLPPISQYIDAAEADRVKRHLSYRLGEKMIESSRSFSGFILMPWILIKEARQFKKEKTGNFN